MFYKRGKYKFFIQSSKKTFKVAKKHLNSMLSSTIGYQIKHRLNVGYTPKKASTYCMNFTKCLRASCGKRRSKLFWHYSSMEYIANDSCRHKQFMCLFQVKVNTIASPCCLVVGNKLCVFRLKLASSEHPLSLLGFSISENLCPLSHRQMKCCRRRPLSHLMTCRF